MTAKLLGNWVEERRCEQLDKDNKNAEGVRTLKFMRSGHEGLIKTEHQSDYETTIQSSYPNPQSNTSCVLSETIGGRKKLTEGSLYNMVAAEIRAEAEEHAKPPPINYNSTTRSDFFKEVKGSEEGSEKEFQLDDKTLTYWSQNTVKVTGTTAAASEKCPFHKNAKFSCPLEQRLDDYMC